MKSRLRLWQKYVELQVFNELSRTWAKLMLIPTIVSVTCTIIICFYATIRHEDLPAVLIPAFVYVGAVLLGIVFWIAKQALSAIRTSEAVIANLTSVKTDQAGNENIGQELKNFIVRRGNATRKLFYMVGNFMEVSSDVPICMWDEILNQVLFLLSF